MKGVSNMKKVLEFMKLVGLYIIGFVIFVIVVALVEFILLLCLSEGGGNFFNIFIEDIYECVGIYTIIFLIIFVINLICSFIITKKLNKKLNDIK